MKKSGLIGNKNAAKHDLHKSLAYRSWQGMRNRCLNKNDPNFNGYGGRGIKICAAWDSFENFFSDMGEPARGMSLDRVDNNAGYGPSNCRWATMKQQGNNRRSNNVIEYAGERKTLEAWAECIGIKSNTLWMRLYHSHWSVERAFTTPLVGNAGRFV